MSTHNMFSLGIKQEKYRYFLAEKSALSRPTDFILMDVSNRFKRINI